MCVTGTPFNYWGGAQSSIRGILSEGFFVHMIGGILSTLQNLQGGVCPPCQKLQGVLCPPCKKLERGFVHLCQNEQGELCPGGVLSGYHVHLIISFKQL